MNLLAFDTSTDTLSVAVGKGAQVWQHSGAGGAQASSALIPAILALMSQAVLRFEELDAIAFGRGPGSFTGLRTACSVAQGLALGAGVPVLPVDTLLAVAEEARHALGGVIDAAADTAGAINRVKISPVKICAALDARMGEWYLAYYDFNSAVSPYDADIGQISSKSFDLIKPEAWALPAGYLLAGNVPHPACMPALPTATAMLRLAPALLARGMALPPEQALPLYVRDKVAQTTQERDDAKRVLAA